MGVKNDSTLVFNKYIVYRFLIELLFQLEFYFMILIIDPESFKNLFGSSLHLL